MKYQVHSDFAYEDIIDCIDDSFFKHQIKQYKNIVVNYIKIHRENNSIGKEIGEYYTIEYEDLNDEEERQSVAIILKETLENLLKNEYKKVLVVGLGNRQITADRLGPKVCDELLVTAHLYALDMKDMLKGTREVAVIAPGVMGQTGLETSEIIQSLKKQFKPDVIIAIDALATKNMSRINKMIQITDTGIQPGGGVGNKRKALNEKTLKVPVIAIGIATVVHMEAVIYEALTTIHQEEYAQEIMQSIKEKQSFQMVVTPKEMDEQLHHLIQVLAEGINRALHKRFSNL